jgi:hypothetical protein
MQPTPLGAALLAHLATITLVMTALAFLVGVGRAINRTFPRLAPWIASRYPRVAHFAVAVMHIAADLAPFALALWRMVTGVPFPMPPVPPIDPPDGDGPGAGSRPAIPPPPPVPVPAAQNLRARDIPWDRHTARRFPAWGAFAAVLAVLAFGSGCAGDQDHKLATSTIVTGGGVVAALQAEHQHVYTVATDTLRAQVRGDGGHSADYDVQVAPINRAFEARGRAIQDLDASLYAAAALADAAKHGDPATYAIAARNVLAVIDRSITVLQDGSVLPAVTIPPEVQATVRLLETLAEVDPNGR